MYKLFAAAGIAALLFSCSGSEEQTESEDQTNDVDTVSIDSLEADSLLIEEDPLRREIDVNKLLGKSEFLEVQFPLVLDSAFIDEHSEEGEEYNLTFQEAQYLNFEMLENEATGMSSYDITTFITMDSLIQYDEMDEYQDNIDLGQARYSHANTIGKIAISDQSFLMLWMTDYATYEACPYGWGTCVFGTLFTNDIALNTTVLAENSGGGDPPAWGETRVSSELFSDKILIKRISMWGEEDYDTGEEITEKEEKDFEVTINPTGLEDVEEK